MKNFSFCGVFQKPSSNSKHGFVEELKNGHLKLNASVKAGDQMGFVELFGGKFDAVRTFGKDKEKLEIPWSERLDEENIQNVAGWRTYKISLGKSADGVKREKTFITSYDMVQYIMDHEDDIVGKKVIVTGTVNTDTYNGKVYDKFEIQNLYVLGENAEVKDKLKVTMVYFWNKDCVDESEWDEKKIITINGYTEEYVKDLKEKRYLSQQVVFNASGIDENNEIHKRQLDYRLSKIKTNQSAYQTVKIECIYVNGAVETTDFTIEDLSPAQKEQVELGIKEVSDFKPKGSIVGEYKKEYRITDFDLTGDYAEGVIKNYASKEDFEAKIYGSYDHLDDDDFMPVPENIDDDIPFFNDKKKEDKKEDVDVDDLFGNL